MNPVPILNTSESTENQINRDAMFDYVATRNAILFVGAGSSQRCGYPSWGELLRKLGEIVNLSTPSNSDLRKNPMLALNFIEQVKVCIKTRDGCLDQYFAALQRMFAPKKPKSHDAFHERLVGLPFRAIVTCNYDEILESALGAIYLGKRAVSCDIDDDARASSSEFLRSLDQITNPPAVLHIHGIYSKPKKIILSEQDYLRAYGWMHDGRGKISQKEFRDIAAWTIQSRLVWALLATRRLIFIGFSVTDPYFIYLLEIVTKDLWEWNQQNHFAILGLSKDDAEEGKSFAKRLLQIHGIQVVFYENPDGSHSALDQLIQDASFFCKTGDRKGWLEAANTRLEEGPIHP
jgi:hypothetical protein